MPKTYVAGDQLTAAEYNQVVKVAGLYGTDAGGDDTYAVTFSPVPTTYADGDVYNFKPATANTGPCTFDANGLGPKSIKKFVASGKVDLITGDILASQPCTLIYDGTDMILISKNATSVRFAQGTTQKALADASVVQNIAHGLGAIPSIVNIDIGFCNNASISICKIVLLGASSASYLSLFYDDGTASSAAQSVEVTSSSGNLQVATVTADATNIIINWTKNGSPTGQAMITWQAQINN